MGPKGTARRVKRFLASVDLNRFRVNSQARFDRTLSSVTQAFVRALPPKARHWGMARKVLNIFLRDAAWNRHTCRRFGLRRVERWMEVPLDSHVGSQLRESRYGEHLPKWKTVKRLTPEQSAAFQTVAATVARSKGILRVDLDVYYWGNPRHG